MTQVTDAMELQTVNENEDLHWETNDDEDSVKNKNRDLSSV